MFIATGVAQQKAIRQKGFSLLEEDIRIFIQRTAINATTNTSTVKSVHKLVKCCGVLVFERSSGMYSFAVLSSSKW